MLRNRAIGLLSAVALMAGVAVTIGEPAGAASTTLLPVFSTTTSVVATPSVVVSTNDGGEGSGFTAQSTTLKATVVESPLGGLLATPTGTVTFTAVDTHGDRLSLGSASLSICLLNLDSCTASISTSAFYVAAADQAKENGTTWTVTATYGGGLVASGSAGTTPVTAVEGESTSCVSTEGCSLDVYNGDGSAEMNLQIYCTTSCEDDAVLQHSNAIRNAPNSAVSGEAYAGFGAPPMSGGTSPCQAVGDAFDGSGDSINAYTYFPTTLVSASSPAVMTYSLFGPQATVQGTSANPSAVCYGATVEFTQANGSAAPFDPTTGEYEGVLPDCSTGQLPCSENESYANPGYYYFDGAPAANYSIQILADTDPATGKH
jgi:hypothetical protein